MAYEAQAVMNGRVYQSATARPDGSRLANATDLNPLRAGTAAAQTQEADDIY